MEKPRIPEQHVTEPRTTEQRSTPWSSVLWRHIDNPHFEFDPSLFDTLALRQRALIDGLAAAGRGNTVFFTVNNQRLVLRQYYRGGLVQHLSKQHYVFTGMERTRALREFDMLVHLHSCDLPAPEPYACRVQQSGLFYKASLITYRLPGTTLSERLLAHAAITADDTSGVSLSEDDWRAIGNTIARFHKAGVYHADLNAHNVMLDSKKTIMLIDFDRSRIRPIPDQPASVGWCLDNLQRFERSLHKLARLEHKGNLHAEIVEQGFALCKAQWADDLSDSKP